MPVRHAVLGFLAEGPSHPYDIKREFDARVGDFWEVNYGQIYQTVDRLERDGLIDGTPVPQRNRPAKRVFRITGAGRHELDRWLTAPTTRPRPLRDEFLIKLLFSDPREPRELLELVRAHENAFLERMRLLTARKRVLERRAPSGREMVPALLVEAALFHAQADLRWLEHVRGELCREAGIPQNG